MSWSLDTSLKGILVLTGNYRVQSSEIMQPSDQILDFRLTHIHTESHPMFASST